MMVRLNKEDVKFLRDLLREHIDELEDVYGIELVRNIDFDSLEDTKETEDMKWCSARIAKLTSIIEKLNK